MNRVYSIGFLYWITRDNGSKKTPVISVGFMRQTGYPWKNGIGLQIRIGKYTNQFGFCKSKKEITEESDGLLYAMQGRLLEEKPSEIGNW